MFILKMIVDTSPAHLSIVDTFTEPVLLSPIASAEPTTNPDKQAEDANLSAHVTVPPPTEPGSSFSMVSAEPTTNPDKQAEDVNPPVETNPSQIVDTSPAHLSIVDIFTEPVLLSPILNIPKSLIKMKSTFALSVGLQPPQRKHHASVKKNRSY
ncbi:hypothetical protein TYRP_023141 [Tyrophagus putrescentiae]|nr:hypothetical protein TYRP_023141 [Tyrophagus putrescentiae]